MKTIRFIMLLLALLSYKSAFAYDTDVYQVNTKPNVAILFDTSGSMDFGVYESSVNYGAFYNYAAELGDYDKIAGGHGLTAYFYAPNGPGTSPQYRRDEILLIKGNIGVRKTTAGRTFTGDPGDPNYVWYVSNVVPTYTCVDEDGGLFQCGVGTQRLTVDGDGHVLLDGARLPLDRDTLLHDWQYNADGTATDKGFGGMLNAPGWYFSGYEAVDSTSPYDPANNDVVEGGETNIYFFIPGNWINMQMMYNLYTADTTNEDYRTWKTRTYPNVDRYSVTVDIKTQNYPSNYPNNYTQDWEITQADAQDIQICFTDFRSESSNKDTLKIYKDSKSNPNLIETLQGNLGSNFCKGPYTLGDTKKLILSFSSNNSTNYKGFKIFKYTYSRVDEAGVGYKMQRRIDVVRDGILYVIDATRGQINWALLSFGTGSNVGDGAHIWQPFNPTLNDDAVRQNIVTHLNNFEPEGGTPLGEALQDTWEHFVEKSNQLQQCANNFSIVISDGYPSGDTLWSRCTDRYCPTFTDLDNDGWTSDPYQSSVSPNYFDDVSHFMFTHSVRNGALVTDPASSYDNVRNHMLSFMAGSLIMEDAAEEGGGLYLTAYNKQQLVNAFMSLALVIIKSSSYVAPVVSVDKSNRTDFGNEVFMAFFKPKSDRWTGNLKKYGLKSMASSCYSDGLLREHVVDKNDALATNCDGDFLATSVSYWSTVGDGGEVEAGGVGGALKQKLQTASLSDPYNSSYRKIYLIKNDNTKVLFIPANITKEMLGVATDEDRNKLINYIWGYTYDADTSGKPVAKQAWPLGSFIHSTPTILLYDAANKTYIAIGANDGMLHVFDDSDGSEVVAYIFEPYLSALKKLPDITNYPNPLFFLDGPISLYNTYNSSGQSEPKKMYIAERRAGNRYYVMNIADSNPANWTISTVLSSGTPNLGELGETWSGIAFAKLKTSSALDGFINIGVFSGGYDANQDNTNPGVDSKGRGVFVIDTSNDTVIKKFTIADDSTMTYSMPASPVIIPDVNGYMKKIVVSDIAARVWQFPYFTSSYSWGQPKMIFQANTSTSDKRKMFYSPAVTYLGDCGYDEANVGSYYSYMFLVGTGDREKPMETTVHNRFYGLIVKDNMTLGELADLPYDETDLNDITSIDGVDLSNATSAAKRGWYIRLDSQTISGLHAGEKVLAYPSMYDNVVFFTTYTPDSTDPCNPHGEAKVYELDYCTGKTVVDFNNDGVININDRYAIIGAGIPSSAVIIPADDTTNFPQNILDLDGDGLMDPLLFVDSDGDGVVDAGEIGLDHNGDGVIDYQMPVSVDVNGDGVVETLIFHDNDHDGIIDEVLADTDGDGTPEVIGSDADDDGIIDNGAQNSTAPWAGISSEGGITSPPTQASGINYHVISWRELLDQASNTMVLP